MKRLKYLFVFLIGVTSLNVQAQTDTVVFGLFEAYQQGGNIKVHWQTSQEQFIDYFTVYRSFDSLNFSMVLNVSATGNSTTLQNYSVTDYAMPSNDTCILL